MGLELVLLELLIYAWPLTVHHRITEVAIEALPAEDLEYIGAEKSALINLYCGFPDMNWACYGEWGGGTGDPGKPRFPDTRREWEISFYCLYDPALGKGRFYFHGPPASYECTPIYFLKAVETLREGRVEDGVRFLGVLLHYIQDSASFPYLQPIHRNSGRIDAERFHLDGYTPRRLGKRPEEVANEIPKYIEELVRRAEMNMKPLIEWAGIPLEEAKRLCERDVMHPKVVEAVGRILAERGGDFRSAATRCALECADVCADVLHSALQFAAIPAQIPSNPIGVNLAFNPSFEEDDGDDIPDGWYIGWLDLTDRAGRAKWYRAGTHWEKHVKTGKRSVLILWAPKSGIEWRQTWRRAIRVRDGERYKLSCWIETRGATGRSFVALEFYDGAYNPISRSESESVAGDIAWRKIEVESEPPQGARWMRVILRSEDNEGAVWFDDVELLRIR